MFPVDRSTAKGIIYTTANHVTFTPQVVLVRATEACFAVLISLDSCAHYKPVLVVIPSF